jgi:hypothetical protein
MRITHKTFYTKITRLYKKALGEVEFKKAHTRIPGLKVFTAERVREEKNNYDIESQAFMKPKVMSTKFIK